MALERIWWPRQIPKRGLAFSDCRYLWRWSTVAVQSSGSPGPLLMKRPSSSVWDEREEGERWRREEGERRETAKGSASRIRRKKW